MTQLNIEYGGDFLTIDTPFKVDIKGMQAAPEVLDGKTAIPQALKTPIASPPLLDIAREKLKVNTSAKAIIVVSDNTRPVPYRDKDGLIFHIIAVLRSAGFEDSQITILIGAGSHRNMGKEEIEKMLGLKANGMREIPVVNHEYDKEDQLIFLGHSSRRSLVKMNKLYMEADLKIVTGLVESHFMAGASGGRKGICPGIVGKETLTLFHGAHFLNAKQAADLVLEDNPLNEESLEIALMAGCDFLVNATLDAEKRLTGVFAGDMVEAHQAAVKKIKEYVVVPLEKRYDVVIIPGGFVAVNHYQAAKAAVEASRAVKPGGQIILIAQHTDRDPIGGAGYKNSLQLLKKHGSKGFIRLINQPDWTLVQEQWQVQMWCKVFEIIGNPERLIYCNRDIAASSYELLPCFPARKIGSFGDDISMSELVRNAVIFAAKRSGKSQPDILLLKDGPYGIPEIKEAS